MKNANISVTSKGNALLPAVGQTKKTESMIVLISNGVADYNQKAHQNGALQLLADLKIPHKIVDGMDPNQIEKRNELFHISGVRGNYPQIFACDGSEGVHYLGGYNWLEEHSSSYLATFCK